MNGISLQSMPLVQLENRSTHMRVFVVYTLESWHNRLLLAAKALVVASSHFSIAIILQLVFQVRTCHINMAPLSSNTTRSSCTFFISGDSTKEWERYLLAGSSGWSILNRPPGFSIGPRMRTFPSRTAA